MRLENDPSIIDIEASGFGGESYPIEVGVVLGNGIKFCTLVLPIDGWEHWSEEAENVHHISREMLKEYGRPVTEVATFLNEILAGLTVYSDGWVVDKPWLTTLFYASGLEMKFNVSPLEMILSEAQMDVWHETKDKILLEENIQRHRASNDAYIIQKTFNKTKALVNRKS